MHRPKLIRQQEEVNATALVLDQSVLAIANELFDLDLLGEGHLLLVGDRQFKLRFPHHRY